MQSNENIETLALANTTKKASNKKIKEITVDFEELTGSTKLSDKVFRVTGYYNNEKIIDRIFAAQQGNRSCSAAVFITKVRAEMRAYHYARVNDLANHKATCPICSREKVEAN